MMAIYRALLALYPREYQALFAKEMLKAFKESLNDVRLCGRCRLVWFVAVECCDLIVECGVQWGVKLRHNVCHRCAPGDCRCLPDIAKARPPWVGRDAHPSVIGISSLIYFSLMIAAMYWINRLHES